MTLVQICNLLPKPYNLVTYSNIAIFTSLNYEISNKKNIFFKYYSKLFL